MPDHAQIIDRVGTGHHARHHRRDLHSGVRRSATRATRKPNPLLSGRRQSSTLGQPQHRHQPSTRHQVRFIKYR
jgi:hypothetical protein